jgi:transcription elongation GreA/GreB family factor
MRQWAAKHPRIVVDENFSFNVGQETILLNYKVDEETLHSIEIRISDLDAFVKTVQAIEKELESATPVRGNGKKPLASGYIREKP